MNLHTFLHFNKLCPVCEEPLKLYMQVLNASLWKSTQLEHGVYQFEQFKNTDKSFGDDRLIMFDEYEETHLEIDGFNLKQFIKMGSFFLFFMCNEDGIKDITADDFVIDPYTACYYRSSKLIELRVNGNKEWNFEYLSGQKDEHIMRDEILAFKRPQANGLEKVYFLDLDYELDKTILGHYVTTADQREQDDFEPKIFKKELPLLNPRPNLSLSQRDKLIDRFDSWVLMS